MSVEAMWLSIAWLIQVELCGYELQNQNTLNGVVSQLCVFELLQLLAFIYIFFSQGSWQEKVSLAKMSAALECCCRLHKMGELDDHLQPVGKESMRLDDHLCAPPPDDQVPEGMPRPGTTKRRQYYYKKVL